MNSVERSGKMLDAGKQKKEKVVNLDISSLVPCVDQLQKTCATSNVDLLFKESFC